MLVHVYIRDDPLTNIMLSLTGLFLSTAYVWDLVFSAFTLLSFYYFFSAGDWENEINVCYREAG